MRWLLSLVVLTGRANAAEWQPTRNDTSQASLFAPVDEIRALGPSTFPKPMDMLGPDAVVLAKPALGAHRRTVDAIFAYAEGYRLHYYMMFLDTLTATGFRGDVVMAIAEERIVSEGVMEYLSTYTRGNVSLPNLVVYQWTLECEDKGDGDTQRRILQKLGNADST